MSPCERYLQILERLIVVSNLIALGQDRAVVYGIHKFDSALFGIWLDSYVSHTDCAKPGKQNGKYGLFHMLVLNGLFVFRHAHKNLD